MYCPICFNDTLKIASSGVVKFTFDGKAKATSQFFYNLSQDTKEEIEQKLFATIEDYFKYYSGFTNKNPINNIEAVSIDFKCKEGCVLSLQDKLTVVGLVFTKQQLNNAVVELAQKYSLELGGNFT